MDRDPVPDEWFEANLDAILACVERSGRVWDGSPPEPGYAWQVGEATNGYFTAHGRGDERATLLALAAADAKACGNADAVARTYAQWGEMMLGRGRLDEAEAYLKRSLEAATTDGADPRGRGAALEWLGITERRRGDAEASDAYLDESLPFLDHSRKRPVALHHMHKGDTALVRGDAGAALGHYRTSRSLFRERAELEGCDNANEGKLLVNEARILAPDHPDQARALLEEALDRFVAANRAYQVGKVLEFLGDLGSGNAAVESWTTAAEVYGLIGDAGSADRARGKAEAVGRAD
jgi:tetratricopeptide (TPR) repeat protein